MRRIFESEAYGEEPIAGSYWRSTVGAAPEPFRLDGDHSTDVAVIGAGYTGLSAALHLTRDHDLRVTVLDAESPGWGASGRNGGFNCMGGAKMDEAEMVRRFGRDAYLAFFRAQRRSTELVAEILERYGIDADTHSHHGELSLAHRAKDWAGLRAAAAFHREVAGLETDLLPPAALKERGAAAGFHGGLLIPVGFALNPLKYALGLAAAAEREGAKLYGRSPVSAVNRTADGYRLTTPAGTVSAKKLILATNGYGSEDIPRWLGGRYLPALSNIIVTRPLSETELADQGWTTDLMSYDTRWLLHYFRLMPDRRFLFGMRGGTDYKPATTEAMRRLIRKEFNTMFPAWSDVETPYFWSGFVCLARNMLPYVGPMGDWRGAYTALAYHGNGVAMGSYSGKLLAGLVAGVVSDEDPVPEIMRQPLRKFPFAPLRRAVLPVSYKIFQWMDRDG